ncbi:aldolase [Dissulfurispira thermophila]|uniref:Aldolase n=2 Tax=root TaxID=1 RepID=A0A7G1H1L1_9BACT|nr:class II aldolase/adducin family protein [Dissulfurispira thermophila]BCB95991.1 aldolase [Dissulfurispira thermophila]
MISLLNKYLDKLEFQGLACKGNAIFLALDAELFSNKPIKGDVLELSKIFDLMNINTILYSEPAEPYWSIIKELVKGQEKIVPMDCETRTFFHDIPVINEFSSDEIAKALSHRKSAIIRSKGIVTYGTVTPEQAFVSFSSTCFSTFVKYFYDGMMYFEKCYLKGLLHDKCYVEGFNNIVKKLQPLVFSFQPLTLKKPKTEDDVIKILAEAGRAVVEHKLVDSYFGNISYIYGNNIYISQTGSSMDELECCIDAVPLDGSSSVGITASSELSAHKNIYAVTGDNAILHGHPKFAVIMSMYCEKKDCSYYGDMDYCYRKCREKRYVADIPVVSGEIGTGPTGLVNTVPKAMKDSRGVIVFGHGVFTSGKDNFQNPFDMLVDIENKCRNEYFKMVQKYLSTSPQ